MIARIQYRPYCTACGTQLPQRDYSVCPGCGLEFQEFLNTGLREILREHLPGFGFFDKQDYWDGQIKSIIHDFFELLKEQ